MPLEPQESEIWKRPSPSFKLIINFKENNRMYIYIVKNVAKMDVWVDWFFIFVMHIWKMGMALNINISTKINAILNSHNFLWEK